jgi:O-antigen ligase
LSLWGGRDNPQGTITVLCTVIFSLLIADGLRTHAQFNRMVSALILGSVPVAVYGLSQFFGLDPLPWITDSVSPVLSTLGRSNFLGAYLAMVVPFTLLRIADGDAGRSQARYAFVLALQIGCLWLTLARAAWVGLLGGTLSFLGLLAQRRRSRALWGSAVIVLFLGVWSYTAMNVTALPRWDQPTIGAQPEQGVPFADLRIASVNARLTIWKTTVGLIRDRWLLGYGPEQFTTIFAAHYPPELARFEGPQVVVDDPHNLFLDQTMAAGVIGLAALLGVLVASYRLMLVALFRCIDWNGESALAAILGSVTAFIIQAQFNPDVIVLSAFFWLILALGVVMARGDRVMALAVGHTG